MAKKLWVENIYSYPAKLYQEAQPSENFTDKTNDMVEWFSAYGILDWSRRRDMIKPLFYPIR